MPNDKKARGSGHRSTILAWLAQALLLIAVLAAACAPARGDAGASGPIAPTGAPADASSSGRPAAPAAPGGAAAGTPAPLPQKVTAAYASITGNFLPIYLAADQGLFAKHGLDVETVYIASGTTAMQSLLANDLQFVVTSSPQPVAAQLGGAPVRMLFGWVPSFAALFMVDPTITTPEQLRGKTIGISRFGTQTHVAARRALQKWGLDPDRDAHYLQLGGVPEILAGMQSGAVVGGVYSPPTNVQARRLGFRVLGDLNQMNIPYQSSVVSALQPYVEANPEAVRRFARAILEGIQVSLTDDGATRASLAKHAHIDDVELLDESIAYYRTVVQRVPHLSLEAIQAVLDDLAETDARARTVQPHQLVDSTVLEELEREGYLKRLYGE